MASQAQQAPDPVELPTRRVVLYKSGVGYFEHIGNVTGTREVAVQFTSTQLDDVLKSLMALDLDNGTISAINYNSVAPIEQRLRALRMPMGSGADANAFYNALRGARIDVTAPTGSISGRLLSVERRPRVRGDTEDEVDTLTVVSDAGMVRTIEMGPAVSIQVGERGLRDDIASYMAVVASGRERDVRRMVLNAAGTGTRRLFVSYVSEVPVWKSTYRLVLPEQADEKPRLQGWAIVDNTVGEDWSNVELSLVAGAPQSFTQPISQPYYVQRPSVPMMQRAMLMPVVHAGAIQVGQGTVRGVVRDTSGALLPGVTVELSSPTLPQKVITAVTDGSGQFVVQAPPGSYRLTTSLPGFTTGVSSVTVQPGATTQASHEMRVGSVEETITVSGESPRIRRRRAQGGGSADGSDGIVPAPPVVSQAARAASMTAAASAQDLGDLFEYRVDAPITIRKDQSALVPIVNAPMEAERVSVWSSNTGSSRPLRALWITNTTGLTLDGGTFSVVDARAFAGEGLIDSLKPGERRLVSFGTDLAVRVDRNPGSDSGHYARVVARGGVVTSRREDRAQWVYRVRNEDATGRTLIIEHPLRPGWTLGDAVQPVETTSTTARFRLPVEAKGEATLIVTERSQGETKASIGTLNDLSLQMYAQGGVSVDVIRKALQPVHDKRAELTAVEERLERLEQEEDELTSDQERLRENMKALRGSREEKALTQRYAKDLVAQEDRLVSLRARIDSLAAERDSLQAAVAALLQRVEFDVAGTGQSR